MPEVERGDKGLKGVKIGKHRRDEGAKNNKRESELDRDEMEGRAKEGLGRRT